MIRHFIRLTFRNIQRQRTIFIINLFGLTLGLASFTLIYLWVDYEKGVNKFHSKDARLMQVMEHQEYADQIGTTTSTPGLLSEALKEEYPEFEFAATTTWVNAYNLTAGEKTINADGFYVGEDFFNIFSYKLTEGSPDLVLKYPSNIVISEELAENLFGDVSSAIGKTIKYQQKELYQVSGVFENLPVNSTYQFDFVLSFEEFKKNNEWVLDWGSNGPPTFAILKEGVDHKEVSKKIADFVKTKNDESNVTLFLKPYSELYLHGKYENGQLIGGRIEYVRLFSVVAIFILVIACINFMNLSTARASKRLKEIGVKKSLGAERGSLILQHLTESLTITFFAIVLGLVLVWLVLPQFNLITGKTIAFPWNTSFFIKVAGIGLVTGLFAGSYPAWYLSHFNPISILKGTIRSSVGELWIRRGLVVFQFCLSVILICAVLVVSKQITFIKNKSLGYNKQNIIRIGVDSRLREKLDHYLESVKQIPGVVNAASVGHSFLGRNNNTSGLEWEGKDPEMRILFEHFRGSYDLIETMQMEISEGRSFSKDFIADTTKMILNERAVEIMGFEDPIGQKIRLWDELDFEVIGVVRDFHFQSMHEPIEPAFFRVQPEYTWNIMIRLESERIEESIAEIRNHYQDFNQGFIFDYEFFDEDYKELYASEKRVVTLSRYFAGIAIFITCLGLFGLASFTAERRQKEIGIRKALGSEVREIVILLSTDFTRMVTMAIFIGVPISYLLLDHWLTQFHYRIQLGADHFVVSGLLSLVIAWLTVGGHAFKAARINPTICLRDE
jgi:predicted permease